MSEFVKDESFEVEKTKNYNLSIQINLDGFSFLISDPDTEKIVAFKNTSLLISNEILIPRRLKEWLESEDILKKQFKSVQLLCFTENFTIVPEKYFEFEKQKQLTSILFEKRPNNRFIENKIEVLESILFFPISEEIFSTVNHFFNKNIELVHPVGKAIQTEIQHANQVVTILIPCKKFVYVIIKKKNKLLLANVFQTSHSNDLIFNIVNTFQQLQLSRAETDLILAGSADQNEEIREILKPYFKKIENLSLAGRVSNADFINNELPLYLL